MPFDNVDSEYIERPKNWNTKGIKKFMFAFGSISTILDILCFAVLRYVMKFNDISKAVYFQTGWFAFGIISQTLIIHMIRTTKIPIIESKSSKKLVISTFFITLITIIISFSNLAEVFDLQKLPIRFLGWIVILLFIYTFFIEIYKKIYLKRYKEWL